MKKIIKYPVAVVIVISIITIFLGYNIKNVVIDNDSMNFLPKENPTRIAIDQSEAIFGSSDNLSVGVEAKRGSIFTVEALGVIDKLTKEIELLRTVDKVKSITNSDFIDGVDGSVVVSDLIEDFTGTEDDVKQLKNKILSWDVYHDLLISNDFSASQLIVTLDKDLDIDGKIETYNKIKEMTKSIESSNFNYHIAGISAINVLLSTNMQSDLRLLIPVVILILLIALFLSFRRLSGIVLPMLTVFISTTWTIGLMGLLGIPLSMLGIIIPVLMMAVGSAYGIHVISHYYDDVKEFQGELTRDAHSNIIYKSLSYVKKPIFLAGITTIAGFASLSVSTVIPMRNFGIFTAVGIIFALVIALTLIPVLLVFNYRSASRKKSGLNNNEKNSMESALSFYYDSFGKRKYLILFFTVIVLLFSALGTRKLIVDNSIIEYFKTDTHIRKSDRFLKEKFSGTDSFDIIISGEGAGVDPVLLKEMDNLSNYLKDEYPEVSKIISFTDTVKRINQVMHVEGDDESLGFDDEFSESNEDYEDSDFSSFYSEDEEEYDDSSFSSFYIEDDAEAAEEDEISIQSENPKYGNLTGDNYMELLSKAYANSDYPDISASDLMNLLKKETNYKGYSYFEIPENPAKYGHDEISDLSDLLSQYYSMTGRLEGFIGESDDFLEPENIKMTIMINSNGNKFVRELEPVIENYIDTYFPKGYDIRLAGTALAMDATTQLVTSSAMNSVMLSLLIVFIILSIAYKSVFAGLFGIVPLGFTVLFNYGLMGIFGIKLDMSTAMVGSIAIGIGIDYTIHFISSYNKFSKIETSEHTVTKKSLMSSGKAIIFNALSVAAGFIVLVKSNFNPLMYLGVLITITMLISSMASLTIMPALLNIFKPKFTKK